ncbi:ACT domain-containing protein [Hyperthermus butylicus]|uniref:Conserved archaeal protein, aspartokinase domain n=1 Tax=Hyperthermus butylicus (strain DSM 5456 / JCM 9403 / PLM1-5) TaxID=415426 RepID=A2BJL7_HYPBU|nr:ACT domain-containing protein [Hyperthermus butylicus]ABM80178.1 conserved archaeal protein, aspartokinase domain [Hyperthermus butylicus DSM 5456]
MTAQSLSEIVRRLVDADPCVRDCLARGIVNYSELARRIKPLVEREAKRGASLEAVKAALVRYASRLREQNIQTPQRRLLEVLAKSALELRTGVTVATVRLHALPRLVEAAAALVGRTRLLFLMQSIASVTITVSSEYFDYIEQRVGRENFIEVYPDQAVLVIVSPPAVVETPGFTAYITSILARNGININQIESVYTDTILVLSLDDALRAFQLLREAIEVAKRSLREYEKGQAANTE